MKKGFFSREKSAEGAKKVTTLLALVFLFASYLSSLCFAQEYFIHTSKEDFESSVPDNVDIDSSPGDIRLALKPRLSWWDKNWSARLKIGIENNQDSELPTGYTVSLMVDHASLVTAGKSFENGDDIRVVYQPTDGTPIELDRILEDGSSWNSAETVILFKTQKAIPGQAIDKDYFLYFGNPQAQNPPCDPGKVFAFFEDFEKLKQLAYPRYEWCSGDWCRTDTAVYPEISDELAYSSSKSLKLTGPGSPSAVYTTSPIGKDYTMTGKFYTTDDATEGGLYFRGWVFSSIYPFLGFASGVYQLDTGQGPYLWGSCRPPVCPFPKPSEWNTLEVKVVGKKILRTRINGQDIRWDNQPQVFELPDTQGERVGFSYFFPWGQEPKPLYYDDLALRLAAENEPALTLFEEQDEYETQGSLESSPFDAQGTVGWDKISWEATLLEDTEVYFQVATSFDGETWSSWSEELTDASGSSLSFLPESRFIKYKASLRTEDSFVTPVLEEVKIFPANSPPEILRLELISSDSPHTYTTSTLTAQVATFDEDGDKVALDFEWFKNGSTIPGAPNANFLTGEYFQKGDEVSVKVTPSDGKTTGVPLQSGPKFIENTPPSVSSLLLPQNEAFINVNPPTLIWEASSDSDLDTLVYQVEIDHLFDFSGEAKLVANTSAVSYTPDLTLTEGEYFWRVKASDYEAESSWSEVFKFTLDVTKPKTSFDKKPSDKTTETSAEFVWSGTDNISTNLLFSSRLDSGSWPKFGSGTTAVFNNLSDGSHTFEVKALDEAGNIEKTASFSWEVDTTPPSLSSSFSAEAGDGKVTLSWAKVTDSDLAGYNLYRSVGEANDFKKLNFELITTTSFTDTKVENGTKYYYKITSVDTLGNESGNSSTVGVTPQGKTVVTQTETKTETVPVPSPFPSASFFPETVGGEVLGEGEEKGVRPEEQILGQQESGETSPDFWQVLTRLLKTSIICSFLTAVGYLTARFRQS